MMIFNVGNLGQRYEFFSDKQVLFLKFRNYFLIADNQPLIIDS